MRLEEIKFTTPCNVPWEDMEGDDDRVRLCHHCDKNVYNLSSMSREEAGKFLEEKMGSECVKLFKRPDGTIATSDCGKPLPPPERPQLGGKPVAPSKWDL